LVYFLSVVFEILLNNERFFFWQRATGFRPLYESLDKRQIKGGGTTQKTLAPALLCFSSCSHMFPT